MIKALRHTVIVLIFICPCLQNVFAQQGFYVPRDAKIFFTGDSATIFSDVINNGKLGVGKTAMVNFMGRQWNNDPLSFITDETNGGDGVLGTGGVVRFLSQDSLPQQLTGGYNAVTRLGPTFSTLRIESRNGVELVNSNAKVRHDLQLSEGLVFVRDNILVVGDSNPGRITGFDSLRYIVTDDPFNTGYLLRQNISSANNLVIFPVGSKQNAYTPLAIRSNTALSDHYYVNVSDSVRYDSIRGALRNEGVNKTWAVGKSLRPGSDPVQIFLQHLNSDEGSFFVLNRQKAYVAQYLRSTWDEGLPQTSPATGTLTTGQPLTGSGLNGRIFNATITSYSNFTTLTGRGDTTKTVLWFNGYRLDANTVRVYWRTNPEINIAYFVVQRRLSTETNFRNLDTLLSKAVNGNSYVDLNYEDIDPNNYNGISFYRLILVDRGNAQTFSNIIAVAPEPGKYRLIIWPNPSQGVFRIGLNGEVAVKTIVIWNAIGQKLREVAVNGRSIIEVSGLIPGTYMVGFISTTNNLIETKKVLVIGF